jgi:hypothetical protein
MLVVIGSLTVVVAVATLALTRLRRHWPWPLLAAAVAGAITTWVITDTGWELDASQVQLGIWVALAGALTTAAAGIVALLGLRSREGQSSSRSDPPTALTKLVGRGSIASAATVIAATFAVRFAENKQALVEPNLVWAWLFPGFVGLTAGILTLRLRRWPNVGPALVAGAGTAALWGVWDLPRIWSAEGSSQLYSGFYLEFSGLIGLVALGAGALVVLRREHGLGLARPAWNPMALTAPLGILAAVPFVLVANANLDNHEAGNAAHDIEMIVLVVVVPVLCAMIRPGGLGRLVLLGWSLAAAGTVVAYWRLLKSQYAPLYGVPYSLVVLAAFVVIAVVVRPRQSVAKPSDENSDEDSDEDSV